jgi:hypothetical protein
MRGPFQFQCPVIFLFKPLKLHTLTHGRSSKFVGWFQLCDRSISALTAA